MLCCIAYPCASIYKLGNDARIFLKYEKYIFGSTKEKVAERKEKKRKSA
jgi:hypothetical protein